MVKGETFNLQLFESEAFRHFINVFTNKESGVTLGCQVTRDTQNITVGQGYFFIQGGLLRETTGTSNEIPSNAGYYKLVYEIDLSKTNTKDQFNQGSYKFVQSLGGYPDLTQEDLDNGGTVYQFPFCQFRITEQGLQDFKDIRNIINYGIYVKQDDRSSITAYSTNNQPISQGTGIKFLLNSADIDGGYFDITSNNEIKVLKDCRVKVSSKLFVDDCGGKGYIMTIIYKNSEILSRCLEEISNEYYINCNDAGIVCDLKVNDLIRMTIDYASDTGNPFVRYGKSNSNITIYVV